MNGGEYLEHHPHMSGWGELPQTMIKAEHHHHSNIYNANGIINHHHHSMLDHYNGNSLNSSIALLKCILSIHKSLKVALKCLQGLLNDTKLGFKT